MYKTNNHQETPKSDDGILNYQVGRYNVTNLIDLLTVVVTH